MKRILVTGGAGFIGANFVHHMIAHSDAEITVLDKMTYAANRASLEGLDPKRFSLVQGDICDYVLVNELVPQHDAVIHFAAETHNDNSLHDPRSFLESNVMGTLNSMIRSVLPSTPASGCQCRTGRQQVQESAQSRTAPRARGYRLAAR